MAAWERAWHEYLLALIVALSIIPHRLSREQKWLARFARDEWDARREAELNDNDPRRAER